MLNLVVRIETTRPYTNNRVVNNEHWCKQNTKNNIDRF